MLQAVRLLSSCKRSLAPAIENAVTMRVQMIVMKIVGISSVSVCFTSTDVTFFVPKCYLHVTTLRFKLRHHLLQIQQWIPALDRKHRWRVALPEAFVQVPA